MDYYNRRIAYKDILLRLRQLSEHISIERKTSEFFVLCRPKIHREGIHHLQGYYQGRNLTCWGPQLCQASEASQIS